MNNRERFSRTMRFQSVDHPPMMLPGGPWGLTVKRWEAEGLPPGVDLNEYFGVEPYRAAAVGIETVLYPRVPEQVLEDLGDYVIAIDNHGVKVKAYKDGSSMPEHLEYPIKGPESLGWLRERLDWDTPGRVQPDWLAKGRQAQADGKILFTNGGQYFAFLNEHTGTETLLCLYYDAPEFIHAVNEMQCVLCEKTLQTVLPHLTPDYIGYHEDMAFKTASLISPALFKEFMTPYYRRVTKLAYDGGADLHYMDSDGHVTELIPLWLECGINIISPLEVAAGMDPVALRAEYGTQLGMVGGFDKRILASTKEEITREFERLTPVIEGGGYLLACDHGVPYDVPLENYAWLVQLLKSLYGIA
ncbi:MAG: uroporphyrinogen decarboxylase family protein [Armatimonadota bacterium]